jgi:hypothetical protein
VAGLGILEARQFAARLAGFLELRDVTGRLQQAVDNEALCEKHMSILREFRKKSTACLPPSFPKQEGRHGYEIPTKS